MLVAPVHAARAPVESPGLAYLTARAAELQGDRSRSATLFAAIAQQTGDTSLTLKALRNALSAGEMVLALRLAEPSDGTNDD